MRKVSKKPLFEYNYQMEKKSILLTFPGFEDERHTLPAIVSDAKRRGSESRANRVFGDRIVIEVTRFSVRSHILAK